ncbi:MAG: glycosyltransferase [Lachnospiraceae bacterium]|nr:glycosyltransferase [Lachnospiraceae bacterium]
MKVVHLSTTDYGGAYIAAERISESMKKTGIDSKILVRTKTKDTACSEYFNNPLQRFVSKAGNVFNLVLSKRLFTTDAFGTDVSRDPRIKEADVIVLHWVNSFLSYTSVRRLLRSGKPVIWVMHDMWPFTEGWHYEPMDGARSSLIGTCNLKAKIRMFKEGNITMVGPSRWITGCASKSPVLEGKNIVNIPNPIDTDQFIRRDKKELRAKYSLPSDKHIILFGAVNINNKRKGFDLLLDALKGLDPSRYILCTFGGKEAPAVLPPAFECRDLGFINSRDTMIDIYSMADVYVIPSRQENLSNSILEAMSCSLPVVAFDIGGMPDMIKPGENGYLARPFDHDDLARGIEECTDRMDEYGRDCRKYMLDEFSLEHIGRRYKELLEEEII